MNQQNSTNGKPSFSVLFDFVDAFPQIESFSFIEYAPPPLLQERNTGISRSLLETALNLRGETSLPFWDCLMSTSLSTQKDFSIVAEEATFRNAAYGRRTELSRQTLREKLPQVCSQSHGSGMATALCSKVKLVDGTHAHIPLLDLQFKTTTSDLTVARTTARQVLDSAYYLIASGKSFHLIYKTLLDDESWRQMLYRSLLLHPIVDTRYVGHQLLDGECKLRLTPASYKSTQPTVLEITEQ